MLPAWIREGLEKMEREKQKKEERERLEKERLKAVEEKDKAEREAEKNGTVVTKSKFVSCLLSSV